MIPPPGAPLRRRASARSIDYKFNRVSGFDRFVPRQHGPESERVAPWGKISERHEGVVADADAPRLLEIGGHVGAVETVLRLDRLVVIDLDENPSHALQGATVERPTPHG